MEDGGEVVEEEWGAGQAGPPGSFKTLALAERSEKLLEGFGQRGGVPILTFMLL